MAYYARVEIETTDGIVSAYIYDERFDDGDIIRCDGNAQTLSGSLDMRPQVELSDWEATRDLTFTHGADGWTLDKVVPWPEQSKT